MKKLLLCLLLPSMFIYFSSCGKIEEPQFRQVQNFKLNKLGFQQADVSFGLQFYNPNGFGVTVKEAAVDYYIDSVYIGKFTQDSNIEVSRKSDFTVQFTGSIPILTALKINLKDISNRELQIKADGSVRVGKGGIYVTKPFIYNGKHKLDFKL